MSRNAMNASIDAANARDDQRETARREWLESVKTTTDYAGDAYRACLYGNADRNQQKSAAAQIALLHGEKAELRNALKNLIGWVPASGWHTDAPIKAVECARAALAKAGVL